jgi:hypothetical protein
MRRAWVVRFGLTLGALTALALWAALRVPSYHQRPLDYYAMPPGEYYDTDGMTRRQSAGLKLGFAETHAPPPIGAFGNHIITFFGADAFDAPERGELFFNYDYANLSPPETLQFLRHLEALGRLPTRLMIVSLTPPNADNGRFIIDHGEELPPEMALEDALRPGAHTSAGEIAAAFWRTLEVSLHEVFNYNTLILGSLQNQSRTRETGPIGCAAHPRPAWIAQLPWTVRSMLGHYGVYEVRCEKADWAWTSKRDGSANTPVGQYLLQNQDPLDPKDRGLRAGDEKEIARLLRAIDAVGRRRGLPVVFLVTPVYETDRRDSVVNQILDRALALTPELTIVDDRGLHEDPSLFSDGIHPSPKYYHLFVAELRRRGLLGDGEEPLASLKQ